MLKMESTSKASQDGSDPDFKWVDYLEDTNSTPAPSEAFIHVEHSLNTGLQIGMKLEILNQETKDVYWIASVVMTCGELLTLRFFGYGNDRSADFWFNAKSGEFHPIGWCSANNKKLWPPKGVLEKCPDVNTLLSDVKIEITKAENIPAFISNELDAGIIPIDLIKVGMKVEISEVFNPQNIWIATISQNVGGRLQLKYDELKSSHEKFWLFYLSDRLFSIGHVAEHNLTYSAPKSLKNNHTEEELRSVLEQSLKDAKSFPFPSHVLRPKIPLEKHYFKEGMKLEAVDPITYTNLCPATISTVLSDYYFLVSIDDCGSKRDKTALLCCNSNSQLIFPVGWAEKHELCLKVPHGYTDAFSWNDYLKRCKAFAAPEELFSESFENDEFETSMKLEAADPLHPENIKVATITKIVAPLMWLHFDSDDSNSSSFITSLNSLDIYPVGWCDTNGYPLLTPSIHKSKIVEDIAVNRAEETNMKLKVTDVQVSTQSEQQCKSWCPKIYFNHRCFTGPLLSKSRLAELPQAIGPGPVNLVMFDVISRVVNIAYKSSRVLQILQVHGKPSSGMHQQVIKAKYKGKSYRATIEVVRNSEQVEEFCKNICLKLECCPHLFGPVHVGEVCPSKCHTQTKTKFGYNFVKKHKKPGRPPLSSSVSSLSNGEVVKRGPGRKKKRKHWTHLNMLSGESQPEKKPKSVDSSETDESAKPEPSKSEDSKEKLDSIPTKKLKITPSSSIVTRGAKLPNFGLWHHVSPFLPRRGRPRTRPMRPFPPRKVGRPIGSTKKAIALQLNSKKSDADDVQSDHSNEEKEKTVEPVKKTSHLKSNPLDWSVDEVVKYLQETECAPVAPLLREQEIDGQALLMLNIANVQEHLHLKPEPAEKFCYLVKNLKIEFFTHFVS
ncbi:scm-like with four MBT domains protein 1 [Uloborus diversus]|uniref:scm-like with four MBT domains protein 1 n=1 Tax=Uloborus diversus TaxID=327109 RepID=UPI002409DBF1|nr:scm-like with four MBT domains protein 1 [Uloborus diversus]